MIKQPEKSSLCGHCCLAAILNISLEESIKLIGHKHGTTTKELIKYFYSDSVKLQRTLSNYALCRVHFGKRKNTHWIIYNDGNVYDPLLGEYMSYSKWISEFLDYEPRITSSVGILTKPYEI